MAEAGTIGTCNVFGYYKKRPLIENLIIENSLSLLAITDTRTKPNNTLKINGFNVFRVDRDADKIGGFAIFIHNKIPAKELQLPAALLPHNIVGVEIRCPYGTVRVISVYVRPRQRLPDELFQYVSRLQSIILFGDFNARHTTFGDRTDNQNGQCLVELLDELPLYRLPCTDPTFLSHVGSSIIDHIVVTEDIIQHFGEHCYIGPTVTSDHMPLLVDCDLFQKRCTIPLYREIRSTKDED